MGTLFSWSAALITVAWLLAMRRNRAAALRPPVPMVAIWSLAPVLGLSLECYFGGLGSILACWILMTPVFYGPFRTRCLPTKTRVMFAALFLVLGSLAAAAARFIL